MDKNDFDMVLCGQTGDEMFADFCEQIGFMWREYALASEETLTADAKALRSKLRSVFAPGEEGTTRSLNITIKVVGNEE